MSYYNNIERALQNQSLSSFKSALKSEPLDAFFLEKTGQMSLWHLTCYEPVDARFFKALKEYAQKQNYDIPIDMLVKRDPSHKGRTAYGICTAFAMTDKMQWLAEQGADVTLGSKKHTPMEIATYFYGERSDDPDEDIENLVVKHTALQQKRTIAAQLPAKSHTVQRSKI